MPLVDESPPLIVPTGTAIASQSSGWMAPAMARGRIRSEDRHGQTELYPITPRRHVMTPALERTLTRSRRIVEQLQHRRSAGVVT